MRKLLGSYDFGMRAVKVFYTDDGGGAFYAAGVDGKSVAVIEVSITSKRWADVVGVLLHEAMELAYTELGCRFRPTPDYANDQAAYVFTMTHTQFGEAAARAGSFMVDCVGDLSTAYQKFHLKKKRRKK